MCYPLYAWLDFHLALASQLTMLARELLEWPPALTSATIGGTSLSLVEHEGAARLRGQFESAPARAEPTFYPLHHPLEERQGAVPVLWR